jgi:hypothetical protein
MIRLFQLLFLGHFHNWETIETRELEDRVTRNSGVRYVLRCKNCGEVVKRDLIQA